MSAFVLSSVAARAFFSDFPCVASPFCVFGIAAGSPPSLRDGDLLCPHRSPYCLRVRSLGKLLKNALAHPLWSSVRRVRCLVIGTYQRPFHRSVLRLRASQPECGCCVSPARRSISRWPVQSRRVFLPPPARRAALRYQSLPSLRPQSLYRRTISLITPATGAGTSSTTLSVSISMTISSAATASPAFFFHCSKVASETDSESCGTFTSTIAIDFCLYIQSTFRLCGNWRERKRLSCSAI